MLDGNVLLQDDVHEYLHTLNALGSKQSKGVVDDALHDLYEASISNTQFPQWVSSPDQVQLLRLLIKLSSAKKAIEIGVYTGYASLAIADALGIGGELIACDKTDEWVQLGVPYWKKSGLDNRITLRIAAAIDSLSEMITQGREGEFDFVFIDADKINYMLYYEAALTLLKNGGIVVIDNALFLGREYVSNHAVPATRSVHALNEFIMQDERVNVSCLPVGTGMLLAVKI